MAVNAAVLRQLHRIHRQLADLHERLERGPSKFGPARPRWLTWKSN